MKIRRFESREDWAAARLGRITGTKLSDLISKRDPKKRKKGFYQLIADRLALPSDGESPMSRGLRLEDDAIEEFVKATGKDVDTSLVIMHRDDNDSIAVSPDGFIGETEYIEAKCLDSARHIEALVTQQIPSDYELQVLQPFIVNEKLETLYLVFYDPRLLTKQFFYLTIKRDQKKVAEYLELEREMLIDVHRITKELMEMA